MYFFFDSSVNDIAGTDSAPLLLTWNIRKGTMIEYSYYQYKENKYLLQVCPILNVNYT